MCLATVYKSDDNAVLFRNVSRLDVDGDTVIVRDIIGDEKTVKGSVVMVDLANSVVKIKCD